MYVYNARYVVHLILIISLLLAIYLFSTKSSIESFADIGDNTSTIFVSVASYRDDECSKTLQDLFLQADNPARVFVGVCEQNHVASISEQCVGAEVLQQRKDNIRIVTLNHTQARGPTYARYICSTLFRGEEYFVQVDSHTRFVKGWDTMIINMLAACPTQPAVITHYAPDVAANTSSWSEAAMVPIMCDAEFNNDDIPVFKAVLRPAIKNLFRPTPFLSGNFWAASGKVLRDVPFDPSLPHLFMGEEVLMSARLWTSGYDLYSPTRNVVMHEYGRKDKAKYWDDIKDYRTVQKDTLRKVRFMLGISDIAVPFEPRYGMGSRRSLSDYWTFAEVDIANKSVRSRSKFCPLV